MTKKTKEKTEEVKQLDLDIKEPFKNRFYKAKRKFTTTVLILEVRKFLKDPLVWALLVISIFLIYFQIMSILRVFEDLPSSIPILAFYSTPSKQLIEKDFIYIIPALSVFFLLVAIIFISRNYNRERNIVKLLLVSMLIFVLFLTISLIKIVAI